jgi:ribosomal 30S subunit maturation factor RimM
LFRPRRAMKDGGARGVVFIGDERAALKRVRWISPDSVVLAVSGIGDRETAEAKKGLLVEIEARDAPAALADVADGFVGARAVDAENAALLGVVRSVEDNGAQPLLVIESEHGESLVPCVDAFVAGSEVDAASGEVVVRIRAIPGLFAEAPSESQSESESESSEEAEE